MRFYQLVAAAGLAQAAVPQLPFPTTCAGVPALRFPQMTLASGWKVTKIAGGMSGVRTVVWDPLGHLLVAQAGKGISVHTFGADGCINSTAMLVSDTSLNHGLALTPDGKTLYVSSQTTAYSYAYDADTMKATGKATVVKSMSTGIHSTRNLLVVPQQPNMVLLQVGSNQNIDSQSAQKGTGRAIVKIFDMSKVPSGGYSYNTDGEVFGYGMRNEIGFTADPNGHIWGVENSGDDFTRTAGSSRKDIHQNNPAEKLNYMGDPLKKRDQWFGYPTCFTVWDPSGFTDNPALKVGSHFVQAPTTSYDDSTCVTNGAIAPRLPLMPHSAPIWNAFDGDAKNMYITFHGSWDRQPATGFKVVKVPFTKLADGTYDPVAPATSTTGYTDVYGATNPGSCTANGLTQSSCIRLTAAAWDPAGRGLFIGSDNSLEGEVLILNPPK